MVKTVTEAEALANPSEYLGKDVSLTDDDDLKIGVKDDFVVIKWEDNLKQAMINRLRTAKGELILHPNYGSRLNEVLGTTPTDETLLLVRAYTREALLQEPRIEEIISIGVKYTEGTLRQSVDVSVSVKPIKVNNPLDLVFRLFFDGTLQGGPN